MCDGNNNVIKSQFPPHAIMRTGQDPIILMGWRNWRNYITFTETGRPYMYFWPANFQQNILPPALNGAQFLLSITKPRQLWTHRPPRGAEEETRKKGFRHDYEIQSVRLKWPIAANYRRLNHFSPPPLLLPVIYPYIYVYSDRGVHQCVGFFTTNIQPGWLIKRELTSYYETFVSRAGGRRNLKLNFPIICTRHVRTTWPFVLNVALLYRRGITKTEDN